MEVIIMKVKEKLMKAKDFAEVHVVEIASVAATVGLAVYGTWAYSKGYKAGAFDLGTAAFLNADLSTEEKAQCIDELHKHIYGK
jgi:hypothetical protein